MNKKVKEKSCKHHQFPVRGIGLVNVIWSKPVTIVILPNGIKGIAKCLPGDIWSEQVGYYMAFASAYEKMHCLKHNNDVINFTVD
jgi:hypothetical protein